MKKSIVIVVLTTLLVGCSSRSPYFPKQMEEQVIELVRFDNDLMNVQAATAKEDIAILYEQYPSFMPTYVEDILGISRYDTTYLAEALPAFLNDTIYGFKQTNAYEKVVFEDVHSIEQELNDAFTRVHYLYPEWEIPTVYLFVSGFNASLLFVEDGIAVGADMYLGSDYEYYNRVVYEYQKQTMRKECIAADVVSAYLFRHIAYTSTKSRLLDNMIYRGKVLFILSQIFDYLPNYEVMGYSEAQWDWCEKHERDIWNLMMDKRDLFKTETLVLTSYLNDGPFTAEISQESPGRLGTWVGWQIVASYMRHHPEISLQQLAAEADAEQLLQMSYYKP